MIVFFKMTYTCFCIMFGSTHVDSLYSKTFQFDETVSPHHKQESLELITGTRWSEDKTEALTMTEVKKTIVKAGRDFFLLATFNFRLSCIF